MDKTRSGEIVSAQIAKMGVIDCSKGNFSLDGGQVFNIKNDGNAPVELYVKLSGMTDFVLTKFDPGWNPEIVSEVKQASLPLLNLKWGY